MVDVLVVDDEQDICDLVSDILRDDGFTPRAANDSCSALKAIDERLPSAVILDIWLQGSQLDGIGILEQIKQRYPNLPVIMISGHGSVESAIASIKLGAYDYIEKPFKEDRLLQLLNRAIETANLRRENQELKQRGGSVESQLIGSSAAVTQLKNAVEKIAPTSSRVFISGPAGCGKEVVARLIHLLSARAEGPFVVLNAASLTSENIEEDMFGVENHQTGERKIGVLEKSHGGTLFIDEIADLPLATQGKLLRMLQQSSFERVGGDLKVEVDVRVIAASNKQIEQEIEFGHFREDLYYRLNVVPLSVPPLSERREDILPLTEYFVGRSAALLNVTPRPMGKDAVAVMQAYDWPGNVRQLRNVIEWMLIMAPEDAKVMTAEMLPPEITQSNKVIERPDTNADMMSMPLKQAREVFERQYLTAQLERFNGNISKTAQFVGMERSAFHRKLKGLGVFSQAENEAQEKEE